jgi:inhibitor of cysteine peptidase
MKAKAWVLLCVAGAAAVLSGCVFCGKTIALGEQDNGTTVQARLHDRLVLSLAANPTTGFDWQITEGGSPVIEQVGEMVFEPDTAPPGTSGTGGTDIWKFDAESAGTATLTLEYRQPFAADTEPPAETFSVTIVVGG